MFYFLFTLIIFSYKPNLAKSSLWLIPITPFNSSQNWTPNKIYGVEFGGEEVMIDDDDDDSSFQVQCVFC
jgi:hypothetical protein